MPEVNFYAVLELTKNCSDVDIKRAFRKLAMKWHPDRNPDNQEDALRTFNSVCESFDVLNNKERRAIYDRYGYDGLVDGVQEADGKTPGYQYKNNALEIFEDFFGTSNPFSAFGSATSAPFADKLVKPGPAKARPVVLDLPCTLKELYNGCTKYVNVVRKRYESGTSGPTIDEEKRFVIAVRPGWRAGTKVTFPNEGDDMPNTLRPDIIFMVSEVLNSPDSTGYTRNGNDLIYTYKITLADALTDCSLMIPTLDDRTVCIACPEVVSPFYEKTVPGEGMPLPKSPKEKGSLIIRFHILFPKYLNGTKRTKIRELLANEDLLN